MGGMEVGAIEADRTPIERAIEGAFAPRSKGDRSRWKGDRTLQIYREAWLRLPSSSEMAARVNFATMVLAHHDARGIEAWREYY
jgi:hypothetical protein